MSTLRSLVAAIADLDEAAVRARLAERIEAGDDPLSILEACREGMGLVGERFQRGQYFVSELILAGALFQDAVRTLEPRLGGAAPGPARGRVVIGSVQGDIHDIGKNLVVALLRAAGHDVHDLGVNVPPRVFVDALRETGATVLGLSALLTTSFVSMRETVAAVDAAGLRPRVRIMVGGGPVDDRVREFSGADAWGTHAQAAVALCAGWTEGTGGDR